MKIITYFQVIRPDSYALTHKYFVQSNSKCIFQINKIARIKLAIYDLHVLISSMKGKSFGELCRIFRDTNGMINAGV